MKRNLNLAFFPAALLLLSASVPAAVIVVGNHNLAPNTPNQTITIQVTGGEQVAGEDFFAQIGDGGAVNGGTDTRPIFTNVDIIHGTLFNDHNVGALGDPAGSESAHPLIWVDGTVTDTGTVPAVQRLATLTIDTTGVNSGTFPLLLSGVAETLGGFDTTLTDEAGAPIPLDITNGSLIIVVPEPATGALLALGSLALLARRRKTAKSAIMPL